MHHMWCTGVSCAHSVLCSVCINCVQLWCKESYPQKFIFEAQIKEIKQNRWIYGKICGFFAILISIVQLILLQATA